MKLIAKKPCSFGGKKFFIGDEIPGNLVISPKEQEKMGVLAMVGEVSAAPLAAGIAPQVGVQILVPVEEGDLTLNPTNEGLQAIFNVLMGNADDAKPIIEEMTDGDALILLHMCDTRKAVKAAAEARGKALSEFEVEPETEQEGEPDGEPEEEPETEQEEAGEQ